MPSAFNEFTKIKPASACDDTFRNGHAVADVVLRHSPFPEPPRSWIAFHTIATSSLARWSGGGGESHSRTRVHIMGHRNDVIGLTPVTWGGAAFPLSHELKTLE